MMRISILGVFLLFLSRLTAQPRTDAFLTNLLADAGPVAKSVMAAPDKYRVQIIYTQIDRDAKNKPHFRHYYFNYDPQLYFNPASMVKMPLAFLTLEKLNSLKNTGINQTTTVQIDSSQPWQHPFYRDTTSATGFPTLGHFIKKVFLISDNDAYNRLYQFVGQQQIHQQLRSKGYP
ncbi:MAG TPA: serine hydrolase, partial [Phnomibacter sp.]|nr:serine hydrolase [Phnomibacter sp.]